MSEPDDDGYEYATSVEANIAIMREMSKIRLRERLPRIMAEVAKQLITAGVDFSNARIVDTPITDEEWDAIYGDIFT
jgi:hypothetical protein